MHGWGGSLDSFMGVARNIQNHRITLLDFYGFGNSEHPENPLCLDDYVEAVKEIIEFYDMKNLTVCAHSFGGRVAIKLASQNFPYIKKMLLTDSAGVLPKRGLSYKLKVGAYKFFKKFNITLKTGSQDYNLLSDVMKKTFVNVVNEDLTPLLSEINIPVLLIWGDKDKDTPLYMAKIMEEKIPDSALIIFHGSHFCYIECLSDFTIILQKFAEG